MPITSCCRKANRDPQTRHSAARSALRTHLRVYCWPGADHLATWDAQTDALLALLDVDYVEHQLNAGGHTLQTLGDAWESLARKLYGLDDRSLCADNSTADGSCT